MRKLYRQLINSCEAAGLKVISDEKCCKLLAWLYAYGGSTESVVFSYKLNEDIQYAQKRLNVFGGEKINTDEQLRGYLLEVEKSCQGKAPHPPWAYEICDYYGLSRSCVS